MALDPITITAVIASAGSIIATLADGLIRYYKTTKKDEDKKITITTKSGKNIVLSAENLDTKEVQDAIKMIIETDVKPEENVSK